MKVRAPKKEVSVVAMSGVKTNTRSAPPILSPSRIRFKEFHALKDRKISRILRSGTRNSFHINTRY